MKKKVLVDFYNLPLLSGWEELSDIFGTITLKDVSSMTPYKKTQQHIFKFFKTHAPQVVKKLTAERKQQIRDFKSRLNRLMDKSNPEYNLEQMVQALLDNKELYIDSHTTLDGYEAIHGISWFDSNDWSKFVDEYIYITNCINSYIRGDWNVLEHWDFDEYPYNAYESFSIRPYIQDLIDKGYITASEWKISNVQDRKRWHGGKHDVEKIIREYKEKIDADWSYDSLFPRGIYFGELFPTIYDEAISVIEGDSQIQRCQRDGCNNIILKRWNREYCDPCRPIAKNEVSKKSKRKKAELIHTPLCVLIDKWLPPKGEKTIDAAELMRKLREISELKGTYMFLQSARSMGRYLNRQEVRDMLKAKGIGIEVVDKNKKGTTYKFKRIQL